jgi:parvulin-like peptidyl-prolyl isomerase
MTRIIFLFCLAFAVTTVFPAAASAIEDAIIAVVNDELITFKDLQDYAHSVYIGLIAEGKSESEIQDIMDKMEIEGINALIEDKLILSEANKVGLVVREELVNERLKELEDRYGSKQKLTEALIRSGATVSDLKDKIRNEMKRTFMVEREVKNKIYINPQEVTDYYEKHKEDLGRKERVHLDSIFIAYGDNKEAASAKAREVLKKIEEGGGFKELAKEYSQLPSVGSIEHGQLLPEIEEKIFALGVDEVSAPIETDTGVYLFKVTGKSPAEIPPLEDVKKKITDTLTKEKFEQNLLKWVEKLKKNAYIEIKK